MDDAWQAPERQEAGTWPAMLIGCLVGFAMGFVVASVLTCGGLIVGLTALGAQLNSQAAAMGQP